MAALEAVWMPFLLATVVVSVAVWKVLAWRNAGPIEVLEQRIKLRDDEISDYKRKLDGASPDEAKARLDALEATVRAIAPRRISADVRHRITPILSGAIGGYIELLTDMAAPTIVPLADDLARILAQSGWDVSRMGVVGVGKPPDSGIELTVPDPNALTAPQAALVSALQEAGLGLDLRQGLMPHHERGARKPDAVILITNPKVRPD
jgi:hypothetical protein